MPRVVFNLYLKSTKRTKQNLWKQIEVNTKLLFPMFWYSKLPEWDNNIRENDSDAIDISDQRAACTGSAERAQQERVLPKNVYHRWISLPGYSLQLRRLLLSHSRSELWGTQFQAPRIQRNQLLWESLHWRYRLSNRPPLMCTACRLHTYSINYKMFFFLLRFDGAEQMSWQELGVWTSTRLPVAGKPILQDGNPGANASRVRAEVSGELFVQVGRLRVGHARLQAVNLHQKVQPWRLPGRVVHQEGRHQLLREWMCAW